MSKIGGVSVPECFTTKQTIAEEFELNIFLQLIVTDVDLLDD